MVYSCYNCSYPKMVKFGFFLFKVLNLGRDEKLPSPKATCGLNTPCKQTGKPQIITPLVFGILFVYQWLNQISVGQMVDGFDICHTKPWFCSHPRRKNPPVMSGKILESGPGETSEVRLCWTHRIFRTLAVLGRLVGNIPWNHPRMGRLTTMTTIGMGEHVKIQWHSCDNHYGIGEHVRIWWHSLSIINSIKIVTVRVSCSKKQDEAHEPECSHVC